MNKHDKNMALKGGGGSKEKTSGFKGGHPKKSFKFSSDCICNNANSLPGCQKPAFLTFRNFKFSRGSMPPDSLLYYAPRQNDVCTKRQFYPTKMQKSIKAYEMERFIGKR